MEHNLTQPSHVPLTYPYYLRFKDKESGERVLDIIQLTGDRVKVGDTLYIGIPARYEIIEVLGEPRPAIGRYGRADVEWVQVLAKQLPLAQ